MDSASLVAFRVVFGATMVVAVTRFALRGWIAEYFLVPRHFFPYAGLAWVRPWPGAGMYIHFAVMGLAALGIALGCFYRLSAAAFFALFTYAHLIDRTNYLNHYYLVSLLGFLIIFLPLADSVSIDSWRARTAGRRWAPAWTLALLRFQVAVVYVFGGLAKLGSDWLVHAQPLTIWLRANQDLSLVGRLLALKSTAYAFSWAGALFDLGIVPLLLWRRSRPYAYAALVVFHLLTAQLFQLGMFPWIMIGASLVFLPPSWPRQLLERLRLRVRAGATPPVSPPRGPELAPPPRAVVLALLVYVCVQVLFPLRHLAYPGNVLWTEQGFRFSWMVMLIEKNGVVEAVVRDPESGRTWYVGPGEYLTPHQARMMSTQPDMIVDFAHMVADDFRARGQPDSEVRVRADVSLNGRAPALLVDPARDLGREGDTVANEAWILPMPDAPPRF